MDPLARAAMARAAPSAKAKDPHRGTAAPRRACRLGPLGAVVAAAAALLICVSAHAGLVAADRPLARRAFDDEYGPQAGPGAMKSPLPFIPPKVPTVTSAGRVNIVPTTSRRPFGAGSTPNWGLCSTNSQCRSGCCSTLRSPDKKRRCHPAALKACMGGGAPLLPTWAYCARSTQCQSGCCSSKFSGDGKLKCHPTGSGGCMGGQLPIPTTAKPVIRTTAASNPGYALWAPCYSSSACASKCCSVLYSSDNIWKCHPVEACAKPTTNRPPTVPTRTIKTYGNKAEFGVHVSWGDVPNSVQYADGSLAVIAAKLGRTPSFVGDFYSFGSGDAPNGFGREWLLSHVQATRPIPYGYLITLMPWAGLRAITDAHINELKTAIRQVYQAGVKKVQVRFGPEMNGNWYPAWSGNGPAYRAAYIRVARAVKSVGGINVWAPNIMDCWNSTQDPYGQYFPTEDPSTVDVVGLSFYHIDNVFDDMNAIPPPNKLVDTLQGWNLLQKIHYPKCNYLARFADAYKKEFHLTETGAVYRAGFGGPSELDIKRAWWNQVYNGTNIDLLGMKFVGWFEVRLRRAFLSRLFAC